MSCPGAPVNIPVAPPPNRRRPTAARVIAAVGCFPNGMPVHSGILVAGGFRPEQVWGRKQGGVRRIPAS